MILCWWYTELAFIYICSSLFQEYLQSKWPYCTDHRMPVKKFSFSIYLSERNFALPSESNFFSVFASIQWISGNQVRNVSISSPRFSSYMLYLVASPVHCPFICVTVFVWISYLWISSMFWKCCYYQGSYKNWPYVSIMNTTLWADRQHKRLFINSD